MWRKVSFCMEIYPVDICKESIHALLYLCWKHSSLKESLKNWAGSLETNFQVIKAQNLLMSDGVWLILWYVKSMLQIKIIIISFFKCKLQSMSRVPEKTYNVIFLVFWQLAPISYIGSNFTYKKKQHLCFQKRKRDISIQSSFASSIRN